MNVSYAKTHCLGKHFLSKCGDIETVMSKTLIVSIVAIRSARGRNVKLARSVDERIATTNANVNGQSQVYTISIFPTRLKNAISGCAATASSWFAKVAEEEICLAKQSSRGHVAIVKL